MNRLALTLLSVAIVAGSSQAGPFSRWFNSRQRPQTATQPAAAQQPAQQAVVNQEVPAAQPAAAPAPAAQSNRNNNYQNYTRNFRYTQRANPN